VTTARLKEKVGQYLKEGELICVVEEPAALEVEVALAEEDVARVQAGQAVALKARVLPLEELAARGGRGGPAPVRGAVQGNGAGPCRLEQLAGDLKPEMTGYARVYTDRRRLGRIALDRAVRFLRTEFWW